MLWWRCEGRKAGMDLLNLFSLHGKYFQNDENRFAATVLFLLSETRQSFLPEFLNRLNIVLAPRSSHRVRVRVQLPHFESRTLRIPDADIRLEDDFHVLLEAKVGMNPLDLDQLQDYAIHLSNSRAQNLRLVSITQADCFTINN